MNFKSVRVSVALSLILGVHFAFVEGSCMSVRSCLNNDKKCSLLPLPPNVNSLPFDPANYTLTELRPGVYSFKDGLYLSLILYKNYHLTVIDAPQNFLSFLPDGQLKLNIAVNRVLNGTSPRRLNVVYSHSDADHFGYADKVVANVTAQFPKIPVFIWGTAETKRRLKQPDASRIPPVQRIIGQSPRLMYPDCQLSIRLSVVQGHSFEDVLVHIPRSHGEPSVTYLVDYVWPGFVPIDHFGFPVDLEVYKNTLEKVSRLNSDIFIPGHWTVGSGKDVQITVNYVNDVLQAVTEAIQEVTPEMQEEAGIPNYFSPDAPEYGNTAFFFKIFLDVHINICRRKLIEKYGCSLGGVAVFSESHCRAAFFHTNTNTIVP